MTVPSQARDLYQNSVSSPSRHLQHIKACWTKLTTLKTPRCFSIDKDTKVETTRCRRRLLDILSFQKHQKFQVNRASTITCISVVYSRVDATKLSLTNWEEDDLRKRTLWVFFIGKWMTSGKVQHGPVWSLVEGGSLFTTQSEDPMPQLSHTYSKPQTILSNFGLLMIWETMLLSVSRLNQSAGPVLLSKIQTWRACQCESQPIQAGWQLRWLLVTSIETSAMKLLASLKQQAWVTKILQCRQKLKTFTTLTSF